MSLTASPPAAAALASVLRCCSRSWRSWPVSATRLMGASWRSSPRWSVTSCAGPPAHGRSRRWWPGSWVLSSANAHTITTVARRLRRFRAARRACGRVDCHWIRSASSRRARVRDPTSITPSWRGGHGQPAAHRGQARTATRARSWAGTAAVDHQDLRRAVQLLADQTGPPGGGEVRGGAGVSS